MRPTRRPASAGLIVHYALDGVQVLHTDWNLAWRKRAGATSEIAAQRSAEAREEEFSYLQSRRSFLPDDVVE